MNKYLLVLRGSAAAFAALPPTRQEAVIALHQAWAGELGERGLLLDGEACQAGSVLLRGGASGVEQGPAPHAEGRDALSGFYLVQCASLDEAVALARGCPALTHGETVEVVALGH